MTMSAKKQAAIRVRAQLHRDQVAALKRQPELESEIRRLQLQHECATSSIEVLARELEAERKAHAATQELLDGLLSSDVNAKHSDAANAVRRVMCAMLERMGWLNPDGVHALRRENAESELALAIARKRIAVADEFGVKPSTVAVSGDGQVAAVPIIFKFDEETLKGWTIAGKPAAEYLKLAAGPKSKPAAKPVTKK